MSDFKWYKRGALPPVGAECEYIIGDRRGYNECTFVGLNSRGSIVIEDYNGEYKSYHSHQIKFRPLPIPTESDVLIDSLSKEVLRYYNDYLGVDCDIHEKTFAGFLFDAGWRPVKQQTEEAFGYSLATLCRDITVSDAIEAYRAGCRFVEVGDE